MKKQRLVVIGNGMAGIRCIEEILAIRPNLFTITVFGSEHHGNYNRVLLSSVLQGSASIENIMLNDREWYKENKIELFIGETVVRIDTEKKVVQTDKKREVGFDKLVMATGSTPFVLPIPGRDKRGVITFRTIDDCQKMMDAAKQYKKAAVIGGGLLGLEAARGLLNLGMEAAVIHLDSCLMNRQLDYIASKMLEKELECQGMKFLLGKETEEIMGNHRVEGLRFKDGSEIKADLVVMAAGVKPNIQLAKDSGIDTNRAILVNDYLQTNVQDIYAVGECVEHRGIVYGLVEPLYQQGRELAKHICGQRSQGYRGSVLSSQLKISGVDVFSVGQIVGDETTKAITFHDELKGVYKRISFQGNKMVGAVLYGDTNAGPRLLKLIKEKKDITDSEKDKLFHITENQASPIASMTHSDIVCHCNNVTKGMILKAVQKTGYTSVEQVKKCTKASSSCGSCRPLVAQMLDYIKSDSYSEVTEKKTLCGCTTLSENEIVQEIQARNLASVKEVMVQLNWPQPQGCSTCQGALNYYLSMINQDYVWNDLLMPTTPINRNRIERIETYLGENICPDEKLLVLDMAVRFEKRVGYLYAPQQISMSISSCSNNGEKAKTSDIGLILINSGWEIHVGGSGGSYKEDGKLLFVADTNEVAADMVLAFIQYYRETADFLEKISQWIERIGLIHIREVIFEPEHRCQLIGRLDFDASKMNEIAEPRSVQ